MIKSIKVKNFACFLDEQEITFFNFYDNAKNVNYLFGLPGSGKSSLFELIKLSIFYMKNWIKFSNDEYFYSINKDLCLKKIFNANVDSIEDHFNNFTTVEIIFENKIFEYKYELSFNDLTCNYENFYYRNAANQNDWKTIFTKKLISCDYINNEITSIFETTIEQGELQLDFGLTLKKDDLNNSIFSYIVSFDKSKSIKKINEILDNIIFFSEKDFSNLNNFHFPYDDFIANKEKILQILNSLNFNFSDITVASFNKITGFYELDLYLKNTHYESTESKSISSSKLSKEELKVLILALLYCKYCDTKKIIFIDEFSTDLSYETFLKIQQKLENFLLEKDIKTQIICFNNSFYNKTKSRETNDFNVFNIVKDSYNHSSIKKISQLNNTNEKIQQEKDSLKSMVNLDVNDFDESQSNKVQLDISENLTAIEKKETNLKNEFSKDEDSNDEMVEIQNHDLKENGESFAEEQSSLYNNDLDEDEFNEEFDWELSKEDEEAKKRLEDFFKNFKIK